MGWFIVAIVVWLGAALAVAYAAFIADDGSRGTAVTAGVLAVLLGFALFAVGGLKSVPVKNIGVPQSFGAVGSGVFEPGIHETWTPWLHLTDINETVQTTTFEDKGNDSGSSCNGGLAVRIGGQQTACADVTIQWQIKPSAASGLFSDYANQGDFMAEITNAVVVRELKQVVNEQLGDYNPITDAQSVTGTTAQTSQFSTFGPAILRAMRSDIGSRVNVLTLLLPQLHYSSSIEGKLQAIQQSFADYAVAQENVKVNEENAAALQKLGTPNLNQLVAQCLTDLKSLGNLPAGFNCIPNAGSPLALSQSK
ncbi:MAG TPA: SPFH domain-containing protein [Streptosporangiaceae bacterium]|nr:SPFH domain-containing protein [Streptosporangiaceae bacterium]